MKYIAAFFLLIIFTGCTPATRLTIFNNTTQPLIISFLTLEESISLQPNEFGTLYVQNGRKLRVQMNDDVWIYKKAKNDSFSRTIDLPKEYVNTGWPVDILVQINQNRNLYILLKNTNFPADNLNVQPKGFPIAPYVKKITNQ